MSNLRQRNNGLPSRLRGLTFSLLILAAGPLLACYGPEYWSVHFHGLRPDFFQMPQPWRGWPVEKRALPARSGYTDESGPGPDPLALARRAIHLEAAGQFRQAAAAWSRYQ